MNARTTGLVLLGAPALVATGLGVAAAVLWNGATEPSTAVGVLIAFATAAAAMLLSAAWGLLTADADDVSSRRDTHLGETTVRVPGSSSSPGRLTGPGGRASAKIEIRISGRGCTVILVAAAVAEFAAAFLLLGADVVTETGAVVMGVVAIVMLFWAKGAWPRDPGGRERRA